jgi:hypothetical protein
LRKKGGGAEVADEEGSGRAGNDKPKKQLTFRSIRLGAKAMAQIPA